MKMVQVQIRLLYVCLCVLGNLSIIKTAEFKFDVILKDTSPLVGANTPEDYRVYLTWQYRAAQIKSIGRSVNTGTGNEGKVLNPQPGQTLNNDSGLPRGTSIERKDNEKANWRRWMFSLPSDSGIARIGVFYATTVFDGEEVTISTVKTSETATIKQEAFTKVTSVGETVILSVTTTKTAVQWRHNGGRRVEEWNGQTSVTIDNVRLGDAGIYECYEEGSRENGEHAITRLIVRACPASKFGTYCEHDCPTCWNGGVCEDKTGICICPPGFQGDQCEIPCGDSNHLGASCSLYCTGTNPRPNGCESILFCGPDPIGCACVTGFTGLDCSQECPDGKYGANCDQDCHCLGCNPATGCNGICLDGYHGTSCQGIDECSPGYFGDMCQYRCHCKSGNTCDKSTGVCSNGQCAIGWAGSDCQQALPALYRDPLVYEVRGTNITVDWRAWDPQVDYGYGPAHGYWVYFGKSGQDLDQNIYSSNSFQPISNLLPDTKYDFAIAIMKTVEGTNVIGPMSNRVSAITGCIAPEEVQGLGAIAVSPSTAIVTWEASQCVISGYTVRYKLIQQDQCQDVDGDIREHKTKRLNVTIDGLRSYSSYSVSVFEMSGNELGPETQMTVVTLESVPSGPPSQVVHKYSSSAQRITFQWKEPECGHRGGKIIACEYAFRQLLANDTFSNTDSGVTSSPSVFLDDIMPHTLCDFRVRANTAIGDGPFTDFKRVYAVESSSNALLIGVTVPLAIIAVISVILVIFLLLHYGTCERFLRRNKESEQTARPRKKSTPNADSPYEDMTGTGDKPTDIQTDDTYLEPMRQSMIERRHKEMAQKDNGIVEGSRDSGTYEDVELK